MSNFAKFRERFSSSSKKKEETSSETPAASAKFADDAKAAMGRVSERARAASASAATQLQKSSASASAAAARAAGRGVDTKAPTRVGFLGVARDRKLLVWARDAAELGPHTAVLSERYAALGRRMAARADPPGWDDVGDGSSKPLEAGGGNLRCIKLPVCDLAGTSSYVVAFGCGYPLAKAQSLCERLALLLGPLVDAELASRDATAKKAKGVSPEGAKQLREVLEREIAAANSSARLHEVANQVEEVRAIMEKNVEMILDRGEQLESLDAKSEELSTATGMFRKQARKLKRWHLMNQVKYGLAVGTIVTASVAVPIAILVAA